MKLNLAEVFEKFEGDYLAFKKVENQLYPRRDICAWMMLDRLVPAKSRTMVCRAGHDEIWLDVDCKELAMIATEQHVTPL